MHVRSRCSLHCIDLAILATSYGINPRRDIWSSDVVCKILSCRHIDRMSTVDWYNACAKSVVYELKRMHVKESQQRTAEAC
jgi:hypothetical protein